MGDSIPSRRRRPVIAHSKTRPEAQKPPPKRRPGQRAGLRNEQIIAKAAELLEKAPIDDFSIRALAKALGGVPVSIKARFPGGRRQLLTEIARAAIQDVARAYHPRETPEDYLRDLFPRTLTALKGKPVVVQVVAATWSGNPLLNPRFAEGVLVSLLRIGIPKGNLLHTLRCIINHLCDMIYFEAELADFSRKEEAAQQISEQTAALSPREFPVLRELAQVLSAQALATPEAALTDVADKYAQKLMAALVTKEFG